MESNIKKIASNYIFGLLISCTESGKDSLEYHDAKAALQDLDCIKHTVYGMAYVLGIEVSMSEVAHYCTLYQQEALKQI